MRKSTYFVVLLIMILSSAAVAEEPVYFADPNLKAAVEAQLNIIAPTPTDILGLTSLTAVNMGINDLTGLEYATNMSSLIIVSDPFETSGYNYNQISNLGPLSGLTNIETLILCRNSISDISPLSGLTNLIVLDLYENQVSDISPLSGLTNLTTLILGENPVVDISPVSGLTNLKELIFHLNGNITDISSLSGLVNLEELDLWGNQINDISPLSDLTNLKYLSLVGNQISDISILSGLTNLTSLELNSNPISDISPISGLINLASLWLMNIQISDISPLSGLVNLTELYLWYNNISDILPLAGMTNLRFLNLSYNNISDISPLTGLINLGLGHRSGLDLQNNNISDISSLSGLVNLNNLNLSDNRISDISPLSSMTNLDDLDLRNNNLNLEAYDIYIPMIESYGAIVYYDPLIWRTLIISSTTGGSVVEPGEGVFDYTNLTAVDIKAESDEGYYFAGWSGTAVSSGAVEDSGSPSITITMEQSYTLQANFEEVTIIYVDSNAAGDNDGSSWEDAYFCLQDALEAAQAGDEIRVANGVYKPDQRYIYGRRPRVISSGIRTETFQLKNGVSLKGGYAGFGAEDPNARDVELYETILSGDLNGNDVDVNEPIDLLDEPTRAENSQHVVIGNGNDVTAILDGFTITAGYNDEPLIISSSKHKGGGGGMINIDSNPTLANCTFEGNSAGRDGGGICNFNSSPTLNNCALFGNLTKLAGGGMGNLDNSNPMLANCTFEGNSALYDGGGMFNTNSSPRLTNCTFIGNLASIGGGGMINDSSSPTLTNCTFEGNSADRNGGGMYNFDSNPTLNNCVLFGNFTKLAGGGMGNSNNSNPMLANCTFEGNSALYDGGGMFNKINSSPRLTNCTFIGNSASIGGGGMINDSSSPTINNCTFTSNSAINDGGGMKNIYSSPTLINCAFIDNHSTDDGGAICCYNSRLQVTDSTFLRNSSVDAGGAMYLKESQPVDVNNSLFTGNSSYYGGVIFYRDFTILNICNCTLTNNFADIGGGIRCSVNGTLGVISNSILRDNSSPQGQQIAMIDNAMLQVRYCNVAGQAGDVMRGNLTVLIWGEGNVDVDPLFANPCYWADVNDPNIIVEPSDPNAVWIEGDYHLKSESGRWDPINKMWVADDVTSPCIDAGDPNSDWSEELWPHGGRINMGAYGGTAEASMSLSQIGDCRDMNNDDLITYDDVLLLVEKWDCNDVPLKEDMNLDGIVDANDLTFYQCNWAEDSNNIVPALDSIEDQYVAVGELLSFTVSASDGDGDDLVYIAAGLPDGTLFEEQVFSWIPEQSGTYPVTFIVSDYKSLDFVTVQIIVEAKQ